MEQINNGVTNKINVFAKRILQKLMMSVFNVQNNQMLQQMVYHASVLLKIKCMIQKLTYAKIGVCKTKYGVLKAVNVFKNMLGGIRNAEYVLPIQMFLMINQLVSVKVKQHILILKTTIV